MSIFKNVSLPLSAFHLQTRVKIKFIFLFCNNLFNRYSLHVLNAKDTEVKAQTLKSNKEAIKIFVSSRKNAPSGACGDDGRERVSEQSGRVKEDSLEQVTFELSF